MLLGPVAAIGCDQPSSHSAPAGEPAQELLEPEQATGPESAPLAPPPRIDPTLIPRATLLSQDHVRVRISPDGKQIGWRALAGDAANLWVAPVDDPLNGHLVTQEPSRYISWWDWFPTSTQIVYALDRAGGENTHLYLVDLPSGETRDLTPIEGVKASVVNMAGRDLHHLAVSMNDRDANLQDLYRIDLATGERSLLARNQGDFASWVVDGRLRLVGAHRANADGSLDLLGFDEKLQTYRSLFHVPFEDGLTVDTVGNEGSVTFMRDSRGRNTSALVAFDAKTGTSQILADDPRADVGYVLMHKKPEAVSFSYDHTRWQVLDPLVQADFDYLATVAGGDMSIDSRTPDNKRWIVSYRESNRPRAFYRYDRSATPGAPGVANFLFVQSNALARLELPKAQPVVIRSRDGLDLLSYLTLPLAADPTGSGKATHPVPMVLWVHGGPNEREGWGFDEETQWLANRGYAVLRVNFRGSTGFGKNFLNAGNREYGGTMQNDLLDATKWAIAAGIADPAKIALMGQSYGGYATLFGLTMTPETFACGVDIHGMSNLKTRLDAIPFTWPSGAWETRRVGDPTTAVGVAALMDQSPISHVAAIARPLLVIQGARDRRVLEAQSDQLVEAMKAAGLQVTYALYPDEGHGFSRPENVKSMLAVTELFLAQCLGGSYEPLGSDLAHSSVTVPVGRDNLLGLSEALPPTAQ
jgi:dipeptidyl aminopeptidase/acylaminoacyl peptidase